MTQAADERTASVCAFVEPIALCHARDLLAAGDGGWKAGDDPPERWAAGHVPVGRDSFIPLGDAALLLSQRAIETAARTLSPGTPPGGPG